MKHAPKPLRPDQLELLIRWYARAINATMPAIENIAQLCVAVEREAEFLGLANDDALNCRLQGLHTEAERVCEMLSGRGAAA